MATRSSPVDNEVAGRDRSQQLDNSQTNRDPHWKTNGQTLTVTERNELINAYCQERNLAGYEATASGLRVYLVTNGIEMTKGTLKTKFLTGTNFQLTPRGTKFGAKGGGK
jgi:hypothetical protein